MDILYIVGPDSGHGNAELRWSLASVRRHARNVGRVIVAGYPPDWLPGDVVRFAHGQEGNHKQERLMSTLMAAIGAGIVEGKFLLSMDDEFLTREIDLETYPLWYRRKAVRTAKAMAPEKINNWWRALIATREALVENGYPCVETACHAPTVIDTADAERVRDLMAGYAGRYAGYGFEQTVLFQNVRAMREHVEFTWRKDRKYARWGEAERREVEASEDGIFSISDEIFSDGSFAEMMERRYGEMAG